MKIAVILGTRPEIIKMSPVIRALEARCAGVILEASKLETHLCLLIPKPKTYNL